MFLNAGQAPALVKDDPTDPTWVAEDVVRRSRGEAARFWFEFPRGGAPDVIKHLVAAGAAARLDGSGHIVLVETALERVLEFVTLCLRSGGVYCMDLPRI